MFDLSELSHATCTHGPVARIVIARHDGSSPRETGAAMLVWATGQSGTIGGGALEWEAAQTARAMLTQGASRLDRLPLGPKLGQCCGGAVTLLTEVYTPATLPHPTAAFFTSILGQRALFLMSLFTIYAIRLGTIPLPLLVMLASALGSAGVGKLVPPGMVSQLYEQVLRDFSPERREQIERVLSEVRRDQTLLLQITPEGMDLFNALATERDGVRRGCVVSQAKPPTLGRQLALGPMPSRQTTYSIFRALHTIASTLPTDLLPPLEAAQSKALERAYGRVPSVRGNDAMVPTLSQVWGEVVHAAWADHLDVIGHFHAPAHAPLHVDWIRTMSGFGRGEFESMWDAVARFTLG